MNRLNVLGFIIGVPSLAWFIHLSDWKLGLALLLCLYANNLSQVK